MKYDEPKLNILIDHVGMFERSVPIQRWRAIALFMLVLVVIATGAWEIKMRSLGLRTADIDDGKSYWAVERRKVDSGPRDQVVIIGDSRPLSDSNLDVWQQVSGIRPIQLALEGTPGGPFLHDLAEDEHFAGLVVYGMAPSTPYEDQDYGLFSAALEYSRAETLWQRFGHWLAVRLQREFAFLDYSYALFRQIDEIGLKNRAGVDTSGHRWRMGRTLFRGYRQRRKLCRFGGVGYRRGRILPEVRSLSSKKWGRHALRCGIDLSTIPIVSAFILKIIPTRKASRFQSGHIFPAIPPSNSLELT